MRVFVITIQCTWAFCEFTLPFCILHWFSVKPLQRQQLIVIRSSNNQAAVLSSWICSYLSGWWLCSQMCSPTRATCWKWSGLLLSGRATLICWKLLSAYRCWSMNRTQSSLSRSWSSSSKMSASVSMSKNFKKSSEALTLVKLSEKFRAKSVYSMISITHEITL